MRVVTDLDEATGVAGGDVGAGEEVDAIGHFYRARALDVAVGVEVDIVADFEELGALVDGETYTNDELWVRNAEAAGLSNAEGVLDDYKALIKKYEAEYDDPALSIDPVTSCIESFNG